MTTSLMHLSVGVPAWKRAEFMQLKRLFCEFARCRSPTEAHPQPSSNSAFTWAPTTPSAQTADTLYRIMQAARGIASGIALRLLAQQQELLVSAAAAAQVKGGIQVPFLQACHISHVQHTQASQQQHQQLLQKHSCLLQSCSRPTLQLNQQFVCQLHSWKQQHQQQWSRHFSAQAAAVPSSKDLADILKVQLLQDKTPDDVEHIWMSHHEASSSHVATVMRKEEHTVLAARAAASPLFVLPLRKAPQGFCTLLIQWQQQQALITTLEEYKKLGSAAPTHLSITCYSELAASHGLVLLRGDVLNPKLISTAEARTVMELTRALYTDSESYQLAYRFNHTPEKFSFDELLKLLGMTGSSNS